MPGITRSQCIDKILKGACELIACPDSGIHGYDPAFSIRETHDQGMRR